MVFGLLALNWLIPGAGFCARGRWARGFAQFLLVLAPMIVGVALHGGVVWPAWSPALPHFNLINNLIFLVQICAGLPALGSLVATETQSVGFLAGDQIHAYFELGSYCLVVAGGINYFGTANLYDRLLRTQERFRVQEFPEAIDATDVPSNREAR